MEMLREKNELQKKREKRGKESTHLLMTVRWKEGAEHVVRHVLICEESC